MSDTEPNPSPEPEPTPAPEPQPEPSPEPAPEPEPSPQPAKKTVANGGSEPEPAPQPPYWPEDWRQRVAEHIGAGDKKAVEREVKRLQRFVDPSGIYATARELEAKFSEGGLVKMPGKNASEEDIANWRKTLGVPEKAADYFDKLQLADDIVIGEADRPIADSFAEALHPAGATPEVVSAALNWYYKNQEEQAVALDEADENFHTVSKQALKDEYGGAYNRYINAVGSLFNGAPGGTDPDNPESLMTRLLVGRTADGHLIGDDPDMMRWLVGLAQELRPVATVVEAGNQDGKALDAEISEIEQIMRKDRQRYNKDVKMQERYRELLDARERYQARS